MGKIEVIDPESDGGSTEKSSEVADAAAYVAMMQKQAAGFVIFTVNEAGDIAWRVLGSVNVKDMSLMQLYIQAINNRYVEEILFEEE